MTFPHRFLLATMLSCIAATAQAEIVIRDDTGATLRLPAAAQRIVSLAPHLTENLYAAGAGERLVGAVDYSDFPEAANRIPRVGGYSRPDMEAIVALKPDLVLTWQSGNADAVVAKLKALGLTVYQAQPDRLEDIPAGIENLGRLAGTEAVANKAAAHFRRRLADLRGQYAGRPAVPLFYQVWHRPLLTVGGSQIISDVIRLCGGENVFAALPSKAPGVSIEAVLAADPEAIVASGMGRDAVVGLEDWRAWKRMKATARGNLFFVPSDLMQRPTPRLLDGAEQLCRYLETARGRR
ncbi:MAG: cobalamin-binding protein [Pseudomonadota bacterium]|nr:cobalamin-binding protein [Pseudomonadota bacterium]MDP1903089.1 cobalamin-binding protein [Pseudomonadota bacterium]MDP2353079.1 cobalamin-binding protein [Pseudomonadota bacterium]